MRQATKEHHGLMYKTCQECGYKIYKKTYFSTNPKTGDTSAITATFLALSTTGLGTAAVYMKKKKKE